MYIYTYIYIYGKIKHVPNSKPPTSLTWSDMV